MTEQEMRDVFQEMRDEPIPADSLARVRLRVGNRIAKRSWWTAWKIAAALVLAGCMAGMFLLLRPTKPVPQVRAPEIAQVLPPAESSLPPERPVVRVARLRRVRPKPVDGVPVSIRIETPDPDVVILLVN